MFIVCSLLLYASTSWGRMGLTQVCGTPTVAASSCNTVVDDALDPATDEALWSNANAIGFNFAANSGDAICKIILKTGSFVGANQTITLRIGTSADLTTYSQQTTYNLTTSQTNTEIEFILPATVSGSTSYYVGIITDHTTYANRSTFLKGTQSGHSFVYGGGWSMGYPESNTSLWFEAYK